MKKLKYEKYMKSKKKKKETKIKLKQNLFRGRLPP